MGFTCRCPTVWLLRVGSSDPNLNPETTSFLRVASTYVVLRAALKRPQGGIGKIDRPLRQTKPGQRKSKPLPPPNIRARVLRPANPKKTLTKGPPKMIARATRRISQGNSHHSTRGTTATSRAVCSTSLPSPAGNPSRQPVKLIHGSAIKTSGKRPRISKLQNSNRR